MVGRNTIHVAGLFGDAAEEVPASDHDGDLDTHGANLGDLGADLVNGVDVHTETAAGGESLA
jgi:hypothetical protein